MKLTIELPNDHPEEGIPVLWEEKAEYEISVSDTDVAISANQTAMVCFARQLLYLAHHYDELPAGAHIHFDSFFCKDGLKGNHELILTKKNDS